MSVERKHIRAIIREVLDTVKDSQPYPVEVPIYRRDDLLVIELPDRDVKISIATIEEILAESL